MDIKTSYEIVPLKNSRGDAQLIVRMTLNDEPAGNGQVVLSGKQSDIEEFVAGTIDYAEIRKRWRFDPVVYSVKASYTSVYDAEDVSLDRAIIRLAGKAPVSTGLSKPSNLRDLVFEFPCASQAMNLTRALSKSGTTVRCYEGRLNVIGETAKPLFPELSPAHV